MEPTEFLDKEQIARMKSRFRQDIAHAEAGRESTEEERQQARRELEEALAELEETLDQDQELQDDTGNQGPTIRTVGDLRRLTQDMDDNSPILVHSGGVGNTLQHGVGADRKTVLAAPDGSFRERPGDTEKGTEPGGDQEMEALLFS